MSNNLDDFFTESLAFVDESFPGAIGVSYPPGDYAKLTEHHRYIHVALSCAGWVDADGGNGFLFDADVFPQFVRLIDLCETDPYSAVFEAWIGWDVESSPPAFVHLGHPLSGPRFPLRFPEACPDCGEPVDNDHGPRCSWCDFIDQCFPVEGGDHVA